MRATGTDVRETEQAAAGSGDPEQCTISCEGEQFVLKFKVGRTFTASHDVLHRSALLSRLLAESPIDGQPGASCSVAVQQAQIEAWLDYITKDEQSDLSDARILKSLSVRCFSLARILRSHARESMLHRYRYGALWL